jgi:hypothetical protein
MVQRVLDEETPASSPETTPATELAATPAPAAAEPTTEPATSEPAAETAGLIVDDDVRELGPGQMRKSEFLDELRTSICATADAELSRVGQSAQDCPYIERWIGYYRTRTSRHVERALRRYAPEAAGAVSARDYIPIVNERVRRGVATWATTGEITGVPEELASQLPGAGLLGAVGGLVSGVASSVVAGIGRVFSGIGSLFSKARDGGARRADDPEAVRAQLGAGRSLNGGVKVRMESAFGYDFSGVRVHTDATAAELSAGLNARAFTIGSDIAFGTGEYQPGTLIGDALLAHELAHVVQQGGAAAAAPLKQGGTEHEALEEEADRSAVGAVVSLWDSAKGALANMAENSMSALRAGLRLQRCAASQTRTRTAPTTAGPSTRPAAGEADPCGGTAKATTYTPTPEGATPTLDSDEFGKTSKLGAYFDFGACRVGGFWRFYLTSLRVPIDSAVQPENFRTNVNTANDAVVTRGEYPTIIADLRPNRDASFRVSCGADRFVDTVHNYSRRRTYWKRQLVVEHEAFHLSNWDSTYRRELIQAERNVWSHTIPAAGAATARDAIQSGRSALTDIMAAAYRPACLAYSPQQETRAYDHGAPDYQRLVDEIQARATREGWSP